MSAPWRRDFDAARDPYSARNALGIIGGGGGGGAPLGAEYVTSSADPTLTNERVLTNTASITWDFSTPGQAKANATGGGGNVSNSGTPTLGQYAKWVTATTIQGVAPATVLSDIGAQPAGSYQTLDADLTSIAGYSGTGTWLYRSAADTWSPITIGTGLSFSGGTLANTVSTSGLAPLANPVFTGDPQAPTPATADNDTSIATTAFVKAQGYLTTASAASTYQPLDSTLTALAAFNTNGLLTQTAADTFTGRTLAAPAAGLTITNPAGTAGNPTFALANDLAALEGLAGTNTIYYRSGADAWSAVAIGTGLSFTSGTLSNTAATSTEPLSHGRLTYSSATALSFKPFSGNKIKINGTIYVIPNAGIAGLANTGIVLDGIASSNLVASTTYLVFAFVSSGTVTADFRTLASGWTHAASIAAGNEGVEVIQLSGTNYDGWTLIGMCRTNASSQFVDTTAVRGVISWFNRRPRIAQGKFTADRTTTSASLVQINSEIDIGFLTWAEAAVPIATAGSTYNSGLATGSTRIYVDGAALDGGVAVTSAAAGYQGSIGMTAALGGTTAVTEGYHTATLYGVTNSGTQTWVGTGNGGCTLTAQIVG